MAPLRGVKLLTLMSRTRNTISNYSLYLDITSVRLRSGTYRLQLTSQLGHVAQLSLGNTAAGLHTCTISSGPCRTATTPASAHDQASTTL